MTPLSKVTFWPSLVFASSAMLGVSSPSRSAVCGGSICGLVARARGDVICASMTGGTAEVAAVSSKAEEITMSVADSITDIEFDSSASATGKDVGVASGDCWGASEDVVFV